MARGGRKYSGLDLEGIDLPAPERKTIELPKRPVWKLAAGVLVVMLLVGAAVALSWSSVSQAAFVRSLVKGNSTRSY